jgi:hypothetical protein
MIRRFFCLLLTVLFLTTCNKDKTNVVNYIIVEFQNGLLPYTSYTGCQDANIANGATFSANNFGSCSEGSIGYVNESQGITRYLIQFDVSYIPKGVKVKKVFLTLYYSIANASVGNGTISCYNKTSLWQAGTGCNTSGGISYTNSSGGGLFNSTASGNFDFTQGFNNYSLDISPTLVQTWVDDSNQNFGLLLKSNNETTVNYFWCCFAENLVTNLRPKLSIYYTVE